MAPQAKIFFYIIGFYDFSLDFARKIRLVRPALRARTASKNIFDDFFLNFERKIRLAYLEAALWAVGEFSAFFLRPLGPWVNFLHFFCGPSDRA